MDLLDFSKTELYFDEPLPKGVEELLNEASSLYGEANAEFALLKAYFIAPEHLTVLVGLYRFYFYQHRLDDALTVAERCLVLTANRLGLPRDWRTMDEGSLAVAASRSFGLLRFYLLALKAAAVVLLRLGRMRDACERLELLARLDSRDQLGAGRLLEVAGGCESTEAALAA